MMESWRDIPGFEGFYQASDLGNVRSSERTIVRRNGRTMTVCERILNPSIGSHGYKVVNLSVGGKPKGFTVHSLIALAFIGSRPSGSDVCHQDGDPLNNALTNLRYDSRLENVRDAQRHGTHIRGEKVGNSKLTEAQARVIKAQLIRGESVMTLAREYSISHTTVINIRDSSRWKHIDSK